MPHPERPLLACRRDGNAGDDYDGLRVQILSKVPNVHVGGGESRLRAENYAGGRRNNGIFETASAFGQDSTLGTQTVATSRVTLRCMRSNCALVAQRARRTAAHGTISGKFSALIELGIVVSTTRPISIKR